MENKIAAIIVAYQPESVILNRLIELVRPQVDFLILVDNGGGQVYLQGPKQGGLVDSYVDLGTNLGLGYALNIGFEHASKFGARYVATFDQDSSPPSGLIADLKRHHIQLESEGINCAAVGPVFFDRREAMKTYFPFYFEDNRHIVTARKESWPNDLVPTDALITSGMLVRTDVWVNGVRYDEGLFVDYTDTEWCFRSRSKGYKLFGSMQVEMGHAPSDAPPARVMGFSFFRYSPLRRFYYFRNTVRFCLASNVSWAWKRRLTMGLALRFVVNMMIDKNKISSLNMMLRGVYDAFRGKTGVFQK
jgi:rhamnosyltransferase